MSATLEVPIGIHGLTATVSLFPDGSDTVSSVSGAALTEATNRTGLYTCPATGLSGLFLVIAQVSGADIYLGWVIMAASGICTASDTRFDTAGIASAVRDVNNQTPASNSLGAAVNAAEASAGSAASAAGLAETAAVAAESAANTAVSQTTPSAIRGDIGMSTNNLDSQLTTILTAVEASSGTGGDVVTVTVTDGTNPIQNATVYFTINLSKYSAKTNSSGICQLAPNEGVGTYGVAIFASGYQFTPTTLNVTGTMSQPYVMTPIVITPSTPPLVTGYFYCVDNMEQPLEGVPHVLKMQSAPPGESGFSREKLQRLPIDSDSTGLVEFVDLVPGATYVVTSPIIEQITFTAQSSTFQIPSN